MSLGHTFSTASLGLYTVKEKQLLINYNMPHCAEAHALTAFHCAEAHACPFLCRSTCTPRAEEPCPSVLKHMHMLPGLQQPCFECTLPLHARELNIGVASAVDEPRYQ